MPVTGVDGLCPSFATRTPDYVRLRRGGSTPSSSLNIKNRTYTISVSSVFGAGDRGRTGTVSLPLDFESSTSANSITPANITDLLYYIQFKKSILIFYLLIENALNFKLRAFFEFYGNLNLYQFGIFTSSFLT